MPVRTFDRTDDNITTALGSLNFAFGPGTVAAIVRRSSDSGVTEVIFKAGVSSVSAQYVLSLSSGGRIQLQCGSSTSNLSDMTLLASDGWCLIAASKATGSVAVRLHKYVFATETWTHSDGPSLGNSGTPSTSGRIGATHSPSSFFGGDIGILGASNVVLNDAAIEALITEEAAWDTAGFVAKWMLDQASTATAVQDDIGAADQTAITGTSVTSTDIPWVGTGGIVEASGDLDAASDLDGGAGVTSVGAGAISGVSGLAGGAVITSTGAGSFSGSSTLTGAGGATQTSGGSVSSVSSLAGSSSSTVVGEGDLDGSSDLDGVGGLILLGEGDLTATGTLDGAAIVLIVTPGGGPLFAASSLSGQSSTVVGAGGSVAATSTLAGAVTVTYVVGGSLSAVGTLIGVGSLGITFDPMKQGYISDVVEGYISNVRTGGIS